MAPIDSDAAENHWLALLFRLHRGPRNSSRGVTEIVVVRIGHSFLTWQSGDPAVAQFIQRRHPRTLATITRIGTHVLGRLLLADVHNFTPHPLNPHGVSILQQPVTQSPHHELERPDKERHSGMAGILVRCLGRQDLTDRLDRRRRRLSRSSTLYVSRKHPPSSYALCAWFRLCAVFANMVICRAK